MVKTLCEIYTRVVGYMRPTDQFNEGKLAEFNDRVTFSHNIFKEVDLNDFKN